MQAILAVTIPFFGLVLLGWLAGRMHWLPESAIPGLNAYVLFFALPCLLFGFGSSLPVERLVNPAQLGVYLAAALSIIALTVAVTLKRPGRDGVDLRDAGFGALVAAFPNAGFMGVPLLVALLGDAAAGPVIGAIVVDLIVTSTICLALAQAHTHRPGVEDRTVLRAATLSLRGALTNPLPWAIAIGALFSATRRELPSSLAQIVRMLGDSATPVALFTIGAVLQRAGRHAHTRTPAGRYVPVAILKLVVHPALVFGIGAAAIAFGARVSHSGLIVLTLVAALPSASNVSTLAERYGADNGRVTRIIMASTVFAFVSFSGLAWAFGVGQSLP